MVAVRSPLQVRAIRRAKVSRHSPLHPRLVSVLVRRRLLLRPWLLRRSLPLRPLRPRLLPPPPPQDLHRVRNVAM